jgi:FkbM family methyltransferase
MLKDAMIAIGLYRPARYVHDHLLRPHRLAEAREMQEAFARLVKPGDLCFDIGANIGQKSEPLLSLGARVVAVEPQARCARELIARCGRYPKFKAINKAVGRAPGKAKLFVSDVEVFSSMHRGWTSFREGDKVKEVEVEVTTLDQLIDEHGVPDFCKIDVEGFELEVLHGLSRPIKILSFEFHNRDKPELLPLAFQCLERLSQLGTIRANVVLSENMTPQLDQFLPYGEFLESFEAILREPDTIYGDIYVQTEVA